jgi:hypothetical protein
MTKAAFLNFSNTPVSPEAIEAALKERNEAAEKQRALAYADDVTACQDIVERGKKRLKALRKAADDFHKEFSKLVPAQNAAEFVAILNGLPIRSELGSVNLKGDYDVE